MPLTSALVSEYTIKANEYLDHIIIENEKEKEQTILALKIILEKQSRKLIESHIRNKIKPLVEYLDNPELWVENKIDYSEFQKIIMTRIAAKIDYYINTKKLNRKRKERERILDNQSFLATRKPPELGSKAHTAPQNYDERVAAITECFDYIKQSKISSFFPIENFYEWTNEEHYSKNCLIILNKMIDTEIICLKLIEYFRFPNLYEFIFNFFNNFEDLKNLMNFIKQHDLPFTQLAYPIKNWFFNKYNFLLEIHDLINIKSIPLEFVPFFDKSTDLENTFETIKERLNSKVIQINQKANLQNLFKDDFLKVRMFVILMHENIRRLQLFGLDSFNEIKNCINLEELLLHYCQLDLEFLESSNFLTNLNRLALVRCNLCNQDLDTLLLNNFQNLYSLNLVGNLISNEGVQSLTNTFNLPKIKYLNLSSNLIEDEGAMFLVTSEHLVKNLNTLNLRNNSISDDAENMLQEVYGDRLII